MSHTENHVGKLTKVCKSTEQDIQVMLDNAGYHSFPTNFTSAKKWVDEDLYEDYVIHGEFVYKIDNKDFEDDDDDIADATENSDGTISYRLRFYNGGTCFSEMLGDALDKL